MSNQRRSPGLGDFGLPAVGPSVRRGPAAVLAGVLLAAAVAGLVPALTPLATLVAVPAMIAATLVGIRVWRPPVPGPWKLLALSAVAALVGAGVAAAFPDGSAPAELVPLPQYLIAGSALVLFDRTRRGGGERTVLVDGAIVGVAAGLVAFAAFVSPILDQDSTAISRTMRATYPALDAVLIFLLARLWCTGAWRVSSFRLVAVAFASSIVANFTWAAYDAQLIGEPHQIDDLGYLLSYVALGLAPLDRSMAALVTPSPVPVARLRSLRLVAVAGALAVPAGLALLAPAETGLERAVYTAGSLALVALVGWRLATAVNRHAATEARLVHVSTHDALTGLPNRVQLHLEVASALAAARGAGDGSGVAVIFLDMDRFKDLNEGWGHGVGDELLTAVAERLGRLMGGGNVVCRISGDEFVVVCPGVPDAETATVLGRRALSCFGIPFTISVGDVVSSCSVGVAFRPAGAEEADAEQLIRDADTAMYRSKDGGRNRVTVFAEPMRSAVQRRHAVEQALRRAIDLHEVEMHYQPIVDLHSGRPLGFEALMRWSPGGSPMSPAEFVPIAEDTGLIVPLGAQALRDATAFLGSCRDRHPGLDLTVSVNLAPRQLREPGMVETVREAVAAAGVPPRALCVEITESVMLEGAGTVVDETLAELRALGLHVAADDFGTGYSSLPYLKRFLVGRLKIDLSFVRGLGTSPHDEAIVAGILAMAGSLGLEVVAEGVETQGQADRLRAMGATMAQGYLYAPALPAAAAAEFLVKASRVAS
jgi:diguanylate cyclase